MLTQAVLPPGLFGSYFLGQARKHGPPFQDPALQKAYIEESNKLADDVFITAGTARNLVATVINSTINAIDARIPLIRSEVRQEVLAQIPTIEARVRAEAIKAVEAQIPSIERKVRAAAGTAIPEIERRVRQAVAEVAPAEAAAGARASVARLFKGALVVGMLGVVAVGVKMAR